MDTFTFFYFYFFITFLPLVSIISFSYQHYLYKIAFLIRSGYFEKTIFGTLFDLSLYPYFFILFFTILSFRVIGNSLLGIKIVDSNGLKLSIFRHCKKTFFDIVSFSFLGFLKIFKNETGQSWSDKKLQIFTVRNTKNSGVRGFLICITLLIIVVLFDKNINHFGMFTNSFAFDDNTPKGIYSVKMPFISKEVGWIHYDYLYKNSTTTTYSHRASSSDGKRGYLVYMYIFPENITTKENSDDFLNTLFTQDMVLNHGIFIGS